jgi:hypothetical protein
MKATDRLVYAFYKSASGIGRGLKETWHIATGNRLLWNRGLRPIPELQFIPTVIGTVIGAPLAAGITADGGMSLPMILTSVAAAVFVPPVLCHLPYAMFKAGKQVARERQFELEHRRRLALEAPKPEVKRLPPSPLI